MSNMIINGMDKNWARLIITYGLSESQIKEIKANAPTKDSEVYAAEVCTDLIAFPQMACVIVWDTLSDDDKGILIDFYLEIAPFAETVVAIGDVDVPEELRNHLLIYSSYEEFASKMKYIFLNAHKRMKKNENFSSTLANALIILSEIRKRPYITTRDLAEKIELSERSVQRYIETLRVAGEWIDYDVSHKGWKLSEGKSLLWGDVFEDSDI